MVINTWVTQCCCILYCTVYSIHTRETRYTRTRKYTTHSLVSQNARIIFAVFLWVQSRTGPFENGRSPQTTREICVRLRRPADALSRSLRRFLRTVDCVCGPGRGRPKSFGCQDASFSALSLLCSLFSTEIRGESGKRAEEPAISAGCISAASIGGTSVRSSDKTNASPPGWAEAMALRSEPTGGQSAHR